MPLMPYAYYHNRGSYPHCCGMAPCKPLVSDQCRRRLGYPKAPYTGMRLQKPLKAYRYKGTACGYTTIHTYPVCNLGSQRLNFRPIYQYYIWHKPAFISLPDMANATTSRNRNVNIVCMHLRIKAWQGKLKTKTKWITSSLQMKT